MRKEWAKDGTGSRSLRRGRSDVESVTYPWLSSDVLRFLWVGLNLPAETLDKDAKVIHLIAIVRSPDGLQKLAMRHGLRSVLRQVSKQVQFFGCEMRRSGFVRDSPRNKVDDQVA